MTSDMLDSKYFANIYHRWLKATVSYRT